MRSNRRHEPAAMKHSEARTAVATRRWQRDDQAVSAQTAESGTEASGSKRLHMKRLGKVQAPLTCVLPPFVSSRQKLLNLRHAQASARFVGELLERGHSAAPTDNVSERGS